MSGIVGIVHLDGAPVDRGLLRRMTDFMTFRGPDAQQVWIDGGVGFGHTLLKTTSESATEIQPFTLDGKVWIVADARVDAQADLIGQLESLGQVIAPGTTDVELILRAYRAWGDDCVAHLLGDFAFAIWDGPRRRLYCARDHFGVKPLYYAHLGQTLIVSNTLDCIRQHPLVPDELNDQAIADFLLFDLNLDSGTTAFAAIQRVPPAHCAVWSADRTALDRYWTLPVDEPVYFKRADDYGDRFRELLEPAVSDRLRTNKLGIFMSGGLDSSTLAASACQVLRARDTSFEVHAFTSLLDNVLDGKEKEYATSVAKTLGIQIHFRDERGMVHGPAWATRSFHTPEPCSFPQGLIADWEEYKEASLHTRVLLYGEGPDNALHYEWRPYLVHLLKQRKVGRLLRDVTSHLVQHRRIPLLPSVPRMLKARRRGQWWLRSYPSWLNASLESSLSLRARWEEHQRAEGSPSPHLVRPRAYRSFIGRQWADLLRGFDAESTSVAVEVRHPYLDLRLLRYLLAVPAVPWCRSKLLLRRAMRGRLPDAVLRRPKAALTSDVFWQGARLEGLPSLLPAPVLGDYVCAERVPKGAGATLIAHWTDTRPLALSYWLHNLPKSWHVQAAEDIHDGLVNEASSGQRSGGTAQAVPQAKP